MHGLIIDAGPLRLISEWNIDAPGQFTTVLPFQLQAFVGIVEGKLPLAVQVEPISCGRIVVVDIRGVELLFGSKACIGYTTITGFKRTTHSPHHRAG